MAHNNGYWGVMGYGVTTCDAFAFALTKGVHYQASDSAESHEST